MNTNTIYIKEKAPNLYAPNYMFGKVKKLYEDAAKTYEVSKTGSFIQLMACLELLGIENGCVGISVYVRMMYLLENIDFEIDKNEWKIFNELSEMFRMPIYTYNEKLVCNNLSVLFMFPWIINEKMNVYLSNFKKLQNSTYCVICENNQGLIKKPYRVSGVFNNGKIAQECLKCGKYQFKERVYRSLQGKPLLEKERMLRRAFNRGDNFVEIGFFD